MPTWAWFLLGIATGCGLAAIFIVVAFDRALRGR